MKRSSVENNSNLSYDKQSVKIKLGRTNRLFHEKENGAYFWSYVAILSVVDKTGKRLHFQSSWLPSKKESNTWAGIVLK